MSKENLYYDDVAKEFQIPLLDVDGQPGQHLKLEIQGMNNDAYGFADGKFR